MNSLDYTVRRILSAPHLAVARAWVLESKCPQNTPYPLPLVAVSHVGAVDISVDCLKYGGRHPIDRSFPPLATPLLLIAYTHESRVLLTILRNGGLAYGAYWRG